MKARAAKDEFMRDRLIKAKGERKPGRAFTDASSSPKLSSRIRKEKEAELARKLAEEDEEARSKVVKPSRGRSRSPAREAKDAAKRKELLEERSRKQGEERQGAKDEEVVRGAKGRSAANTPATRSARR